MVKIEYNLTSYNDFFRLIAKSLGLKITDNIIAFTPDKGKGFIRLITLPNGLQVMIYDYTTHKDLLYHRKKTNKEHLVLRLDEAITEDGVAKASVFFGKTNQEWFYMAGANSNLRQVNVIMGKQWLDSYLGNEEAGEMLSSYIALKSPLLTYEQMDAEYKRLMLEILHVSADKEFEQIIIFNRVGLILERFFTRLYKKIENENSAHNISSDEYRSIKQVENELLKDFSQQPPSIAQLAKIAAMSSSKLKILFKEVFGLPVNQYYQKHRMNKAKAMLLSKKYSIREVANALGFSGVSSFSKAFFKAFDQLPSDIAVTTNIARA